MSTYGNFKFLIEGKFIDQPDGWCLAYIGRRYGSWKLGKHLSQGNYFANSLSNEPQKELSSDYYEHLNFDETCKVLKLELERNNQDYCNSYTNALLLLNHLKQSGLSVEVFYQNEYYECTGSYGVDTRQEDLESGAVKLWGSNK